ncbi:CD320 antigen-like [Saccoglossus kowalevskii]|uniref:Low-density lipoprotein receptor-related protein 1-like n=1 Tax=Saccoglossus kowalevskii TaxID=10224 RepID=A0ABM0LV12_SACKO|nr:PREDICTED: low-density lipoprotein receptor-related protein 1-like [Saccoglossus kowalevskii]
MFRYLLCISVIVYLASTARSHSIVSKRKYTADMCDQMPENRIFRCAGGETVCVTKSRQCDGIIDCNDGSDEMDCDAEHEADCKSSFIEKKILDYIQCESDNMCLDKCRRCDGVCDCLDKSDEADCEGYVNTRKCQVPARSRHV